MPRLYGVTFHLDVVVVLARSHALNVNAHREGKARYVAEQVFHSENGTLYCLFDIVGGDADLCIRFY